jgi:glutamine amidotransferase PdxT
MVHVGVLALQGAFQEHAAMLRELGATTSEVRVTKDLEGLDGIIFPGAQCSDHPSPPNQFVPLISAPTGFSGGESTAMAIVGGGGADSIFSALQRWVADDKPASPASNS